MISFQLSSYRKFAKLTQSQVAKMLNISQQAYSLYETGASEPTLDTLKKLCIIFHCTSDELLEIDTEEQRDKIFIYK